MQNIIVIALISINGIMSFERFFILEMFFRIEELNKVRQIRASGARNKIKNARWYADNNKDVFIWLKSTNDSA